MAAQLTPDLFSIVIYPRYDKIPFPLSSEDASRLREKLLLVRELAAKLASGMLKGTLKYEPGTDHGLTIREWLDAGIDDLADSLNYAFLQRRAIDEFLTHMGDELQVETKHELQVSQ